MRDGGRERERDRQTERERQRERETERDRDRDIERQRERERKIQDIESGGHTPAHKQAKEMLRDMGQGLK